MRKINESDNLKENPRKTANLLSFLTFIFTLKTFRLGKRRELDEGDLTKPLEEHKSSKLGDKMARIWSREVDTALKKHKQPSMLKVIFKCFWKEFTCYGVVLFALEIGVRLFQPFFLGLMLRYFSYKNRENKNPEGYPMYLNRLFTFWTPNQCAITTTEAYIYATGICAISCFCVLLLHPLLLGVTHVGMKIRVASCSLMYRKCLRINYQVLGGEAAGNVLNLMSNDVNRFDPAPMFFHYIWVSPIQALFIVYFLYREVELSAFIGIISICIFIPIQAYFGYITSVFRLRTAEKTDERIRLMTEIIRGIQVIKMYTWEYAFEDMVYRARYNELKVLRYTSFIRGIVMSFILFTARFGIFLTVVAYVALGYEITPEKVFFIIAFYMILRQNMTLYFPQGIAMLAEARVAVNRIQKFMLLEETMMGDPTPLDPEWPDHPNKYHADHNVTFTNEQLLAKGVHIQRAFARYGKELCLKNVNLDLHQGQLTTLIGQVGSGKTCLLNLILGELRPAHGTVTVNGIISYACQDPWLFAGSVRQNIIFGRPFNRARYHEVVKVCALARDFEQLPFGDFTVIGERGVSLSGGQRARVNLARAVYKEADIYLLDDPLSAVDTNVGKHIFDKCIDGYLRGKIVVLATHQLQYVKKAEQIVLLSEGVILAKGSHAQLKATNYNFAKLLDQLPPTEIVDYGQDLPVVTSAIRQASFRNAHSMVVDVEGSMISAGSQEKEQVEPPEMRTYGAVSFEIYKQYFKAGGTVCTLILMVFLFLAAQSCASAGDIFINIWAHIEEKRKTDEYYVDHFLTKESATIIFSVIMVLTVIVALTRAYVFYSVCLRASLNLHNWMFESICTASMRFFHTNTSGRILNRFSKDLGSIDEFLPNAMIDFVQITLNFIGVIVVVLTVNIFLLIPIAIISVLFYFLRRYYLRTSRNVKRLDGITRSPVFAHLNATLQGVTTVRVNGAEVILTAEFDRCQDIHSSAWYMFITTARAFGYWLDCLCAIFIGIVTWSFYLQEEAFSGSVGLGITQACSLTILFQWGMRQSAELENQMTSVERVLEFTKIEHEANLKSEPGKEPPPDWPFKGKIEFVKTTMRYDPDAMPVIRNLTFTLEPGEKIGIVGRTGAGKSSMIAALFRLAYLEGLIKIDGLDVLKIGLHDLRKKISIIPQEPVIFFGTLRYNLDPFNEYNDEDLMAALMVVELNIAVHEGPDCLEHEMEVGGTNMSVGQRQLICLARAIVRNNIILVMDEATANVDPETDRFIQHTIRDKFQHCTVLTIAHRLNTIMDCDRVLVLDSGQLVELDHPFILLQKPDGVFSGMVQKTGPVMAENLKRIAEESYYSGAQTRERFSDLRRQQNVVPELEAVKKQLANEMELRELLDRMKTNMKKGEVGSAKSDTQLDEEVLRMLKKQLELEDVERRRKEENKKGNTDDKRNRDESKRGNAEDESKESDEKEMKEWNEGSESDSNMEE